MIIMYIKYLFNRIKCKLTGKEHPLDKARKKDPFIYEE
jgi:hypothetical protein